jgi:hypothetical protein
MKLLFFSFKKKNWKRQQFIVVRVSDDYYTTPAFLTSIASSRAFLGPIFGGPFPERSGRLQLHRWISHRDTCRAHNSTTQ